MLGVARAKLSLDRAFNPSWVCAASCFHGVAPVPNPEGCVHRVYGASSVPMPTKRRRFLHQSSKADEPV